MALKLDHQPSGTVQKPEEAKKICVWVYSLFTDVPGDYIKKPMKECTGKEITAEWLYHLGVPVDQIDELAENQCCLRADHDAVYHCLLYAENAKATARMLSRMAV